MDSERAASLDPERDQLLLWSRPASRSSWTMRA